MGAGDMRLLFGTVLLAATALAGSCGKREAATPPAPAAPTIEALLDEAIAGDHRTAEEKARDQYRHPKETLLFFGLEPAMAVVEVWPGGGWYTNILAPVLKQGGGTYYAAGLDPEASERAREAVSAFEAKFTADAERFGTVRMTVLGSDREIAPAGSADLVLTFRNVHNWLAADTAEGNFKLFYDALKPGGVLGVVEHRANPDATEESEKSSGYVREATVRALAAAAGFESDSSSEVNANPKDTKDHPFGVWTLPPTRRSSAVRGVEDPNFDRAKYDAIGESDRMTLKFRKPLAADGALLQ
jgi:predicted methyltransferase